MNMVGPIQYWAAVFVCLWLFVLGVVIGIGAEHEETRRSRKENERKIFQYKREINKLKQEINNLRDGRDGKEQNNDGAELHDKLPKSDEPLWW